MSQVRSDLSNIDIELHILSMRIVVTLETRIDIIITIVATRILQVFEKVIKVLIKYSGFFSILLLFLFSYVFEFECC